MPENVNQNVNSENNTLKNINRIDEFLKSRQPQIAKILSERHKQLSDARVAVQDKRAKLVKEIEEKVALEQARQKAEKENAEAIRQAAEEQLKELAAKTAEVEAREAVKEEEPQKADSAKETAETTVEEPKQSETVAKVEPTPAPATATTTVDTPKVDTKKTEKKAVEATARQPVATQQPRQDGTSKQIEAAKAAAQSILAKPKKQIDKPVIRVYIPPVEEQRGRRQNNQRPQQQGGQSNATAPRYNNNSQQTRQQNAVERLNNTPILPTKDASKKKVVTDSPRPDDKTMMNKKAISRKGYDERRGTNSNNYDDEGNDLLEGNVVKKRSRRIGGNQRKEFNLTETVVIEHAIITKENVPIKELAEKIGKTGTEIIKRLFQLGIMKTINDSIDFDTAELVANDLGITLELQKAETSEEKLKSIFNVETDSEENLSPRPPIVTVMGHVDHGKTSILDCIKKSNVAAGEAGGITQHISAYTINVNGQQISFLDTPGHAAFTAMRARGANVTDIVVIVVAADDGVMPQTVEVINHAKASGSSIIVAINKIDKPAADVDRVMSQLPEYDLLPEAWGGTTPVVKVSAKTGEGIDELLETILLVAEVMELKANPKRNAQGTVVEARLDKGKGPLATILVQNGTLHVGDHVVAGVVTGKIRAMQDDKGKPVKSAGPSSAVVILGLDEVPNAGDQLLAVEDEKLLKDVVSERIARDKERRITNASVTLEDVFRGIEEGKMKTLNLIVKADVQGSVEAITESLLKLSTDEVKVVIPHAMVGAINESDIILAESVKAIIIGFNVRPDAKAKALADNKKIEIRMYRIIYDAIDDVTSAIKGLSAPKYREQYLGKAEVRQIYKISSVGTIAGCMVLDGKIVRNAKVRLIRDNIVIADTAISSLKRMKDDMREVVSGYECGIGLDNWNDIKEGDIIESFNIVEEKR